MIKKIIKKFVKTLLSKYNYKIEKIQKPNVSNLVNPSADLIKAINQCSGILHFGAHRGDEAAIYQWFGKKTIWFEANPKIFEDLKINLLKYSFQKAYCELLTDQDNKDYLFNISSNDGASSSIFELGTLSGSSDKGIWKKKNLKMKKKITIKSITLDTFIDNNKIDLKSYDHWVIDVQGCEILLLDGAKNSLSSCKSIFIEVSQGEVYKNGAQWNEVEKLLKSYNFFPTTQPEKLHCDILFLKNEII